MSVKATCCGCGKEGISPDKHRCIPELKDEIARLTREVERLKEREKELDHLVVRALDINDGLQDERDKYRKDLAAARKELDDARGLLTEIIGRVWDRSKDEDEKYMVTIVITKDQHDQIVQILKGGGSTE